MCENAVLSDTCPIVTWALQAPETCGSTQPLSVPFPACLPVHPGTPPGAWGTALYLLCSLSPGWREPNVL